MGGGGREEPPVSSNHLLPHPCPVCLTVWSAVCSSHCVQGRAGEEGSLACQRVWINLPTAPSDPGRSLDQPGEDPARTGFWFLLYPSDVKGGGPKTHGCNSFTLLRSSDH